MQCLCLLHDHYISKPALIWLLASPMWKRKLTWFPLKSVSPYCTNQTNETNPYQTINNTPDLEFYVNDGKQIAYQNRMNKLMKNQNKTKSLLKLFILTAHSSLLIGGNLYLPAAAAKSLQSCLTRCNPTDGSLPCSPVPGILQARTLEWVAISFSNAWKWKVKGSRSVVSNSSRPHGLQPTRLLRPWGFPGKSTGVRCPYLPRVWQISWMYL